MAQSKRSRFVRCIRLLRERMWTKRELAEELAVSVRTVERFLADIEQGGIELTVHDHPMDNNHRTYGITYLR